MYAKAFESSDLNALLNNPSKEPLVVELPARSVFRQKVVVERDDLTVVGNGSVVVWDDHNGMTPGFGTGDSATLTIKGSRVKFEDLVVENSFDYCTNRQLRKEDPSSMMGLQAVAVFVTPSSCDVWFRGCSFLGWQDTLFIDGSNAFFSNCFVKGNVDFIFGKSNAVFEGCTIESCGAGFVTAPSTLEDCKKGFAFEGCDFVGSGLDEGSVYLARPWHPGGRPGVSSCAEFRNCRFGTHIDKRLWTSMRDSKGLVHTPEENRFFVDWNTCKWSDR